MSSQRYQETHARIQDLGNRLLQYLQALQTAPSEQRDRHHFASSEAGLQRALHALEAQRYQVAAIAAMKAGKSTLLNALIGAEVLASESESCTVCRTDVRPIAPEQTPQLLEYREGEREPIGLAAGDAATIRQTFLDRTHQIRATANRDRVLRFELTHPIAALDEHPALAGFVLVDTPGPNEWETAGFDTVALKATALDALRNCDVILFVLDYTSFRDNTNAELLQELLAQRQEFLARNRGALHFILNKIDCHTEGDRPLTAAIDDLQQHLEALGIPQPHIHPVSAWQGLLAKLIASSAASEAHLKNFKQFFSGRYIRETEDGDLIAPAPRKIAPQALADSAIPDLEATVIRQVAANAGWSLLSNVLAKLEKTATENENLLNAQIGGWTLGIEPLRQRIEAYKQLAKSAIIQIRDVKKLVEQQKQKLIVQFKTEIGHFAERAKLTIQHEFEAFIQDHSTSASDPDDFTNLDSDSGSDSRTSELVASLNSPPDAIEGRLPGIAAIFPVSKRVANSLKQAIRDFLFMSDSPYKIRCENPEEVERVKQEINRFCALSIKDWWLATQDRLSQQGTQIRQELADEIRDNIQMISDGISTHLGEALEIKMNVNPIQMLSFEFQGIDAQVQQQTENYTRWETEQRKAFCRDYEIDVQVDDCRSYYEIDLLQTLQAIEREIDAQTIGSLAVVKKAIEQQVADDFNEAEQQINEYINRFLTEFDRLLHEREQREAKADEVLATLTEQKESLAVLQAELTALRASLTAWQPD